MTIERWNDEEIYENRGEKLKSHKFCVLQNFFIIQDSNFVLISSRCWLSRIETTSSLFLIKDYHFVVFGMSFFAAGNDDVLRRENTQ